MMSISVLFTFFLVTQKQIFSFWFLYSRFSKKPSMSRNIRLCTHRCAKCWLKKLRILIPLIAMPAPSSGCCSTSVAWSSRTAFRSPSSMKSTPGEISRLNHRWRYSRLKILWIPILLIFSKTIIFPAKLVIDYSKSCNN